MRSAKLGDVYSVKVPNGYKIIQWAYNINKYGRFVRVFDGLYDSLPRDILEIVDGPHSYIVDLYVSRAYRIGLLNWIGNYPVLEKYPFPEHQIELCFGRDGVNGVRITQRHSADTFRYDSDKTISTINVLPEQYRGVMRLAHRVSPDWLLYLFDNDFSMHNLNVFNPWLYWGDQCEEKFQIYIDMVEEAMEKDRTIRRMQKTANAK